MNLSVSRIFYYLRTLLQIWKLSAKQLLEYRFNILAQGAFILFYLAGLLMMLEIIFTKTQSLGGWSKPEILLLYGICGIVWGFMEMFYFASLMRFMTRGVSAGEFDILLTKPLDSQFLATFMYPRIQEIIYPSSSIILTIWVISTNTFHLLPQNVAYFLLSVILTQLILLFLFSAYSSLAFFITRSEQVLRLFQTLGDHSQYPTSIYPVIFKVSLLSFLGIGLIAYIPTAFLLGKMPAYYLIPLFLGMCLTAILSRIAWKHGLRHYSSASS